jgi:hypothetical protein
MQGRNAEQAFPQAARTPASTRVVSRALYAAEIVCFALHSWLLVRSLTGTLLRCIGTSADMN